MILDISYDLKNAISNLIALELTKAKINDQHYTKEDVIEIYEYMKSKV